MSEETASAITLPWLEWLYEKTSGGCVWVGGHRNWRGAAFGQGGIDGAVAYAMAMDAAGSGLDGVYHRLTTVSLEGARGRGRDAASVMLPAVMLDLDIAGPGHKRMALPTTEDELREVLADAGLPVPSAWVNSGGGRYPVWRLAAPLDLTIGEDAFSLGQDALRTIQRAVREAAARRGWELDNTSDLARVYRLPGTTNRKAGQGREVTATWALAGGGDFEIGHLLAGLKQQAAGVSNEVSRVSSGVSSDAHAAIDAWLSGSAGASLARDPREPRTFTLEQALAYVAPALEALRTARDGEINVKLNAAACVLAHFGPEFWDESAADAQLEKALSETAYDSLTWKAEDTIASARRAMRGDWRATLIPPPAADVAVHEMLTPEAAATTPADEVDALLAEMISVREMIERPSPRFLIQGLLTFDSESWLIGAPGSKKSFVAFDMAARVSRGERWQGRRTNPADVVMIIAEGSGGSGKRGAAWVKAIGQIDDEHVRILPRPVQVGADFGKPWRVLAEACGRLADRAAGQGRGLLVIIDTQARVTVGLEENSAKEMGIYVEGVRLIRERTGGCVLSVHHTGRTGGDARGSSAIDGAQTSELKVESTGKLSGRLLTEKQKDLEHADPIELRFKSVPLGVDVDGEPVSSLVLLEPGAEGWDAGEVTHEGIETGQRETEDPFAMRADLDPWISRHVANAPLQWWIVQALVDTVETLGLTESGVKEIVVSKRGKQSPSSWRKAWQKVTAEGGQWDGIVCRASGERWSVDRVSIAEKLVA